MTYDLQGGWSATSTSLADASTDAFALASFAHQTKTMLVFQDESGTSWWRVRSESAWSDPAPIPSTQPAEAIALGALGESVFLIEKASAAGSINVRSFNTAPFNVVSVPTNPYGGAQDNTTVDAWSPCAFPVAHFSFRPDAETQRRPEARVYETSGLMVVTTLDGVMHLVHPGPDNPLLLTETFSLAGVMTPSQPVSYKSTDSPTASNGFGTMVEAGWSRQSPIFGTRCGAGGALAIASAGDEIVLLHRSSSGAPVGLSAGRYMGRNH
jgi:hypothetical protein